MFPFTQDLFSLEKETVKEFQELPDKFIFFSPHKILLC